MTTMYNNYITHPLTFLYNFSSNVSGRIICGIGAGGTMGAEASVGVSGDSLSTPPGSNAEDGASFAGSHAAIVGRY